jgi:hypothetical protein
MTACRKILHYNKNILAGAFILIFFILIAPKHSFGYNILIPSQTIYRIPAGKYEYYKFKLHKEAILTGSFITTENITFFVMTPYEYFTLGSNRISYLYTTGKVHSGGVSTILAPGTYYIIFDNRNIIFETNVMIVQPFILRPYGY